MTLEKQRKLRQFVTKQKQEKYKNGIAKIIIVHRVIFEVVEDGKRVNKGKSGFDTKSAAKAHLEVLKDAYKHSTGIFAPTDPEPEPEPVKHRETFREHAARYLETLKESIRESSKNGRESEMKMLVEYFGDEIFADIKRYDDDPNRKTITTFGAWISERRIQKIEEYLEQDFDPKTGRLAYAVKENRIKVPYSQSSINHFYKRLRAMNQTAVLNEVEEIKEIKFKGFIKAEQPREIAISYEELDTLLANTYKSNLKLELVGLFETGARLCELKNIRRQDIDAGWSVGRVMDSKKRKNTIASKRKVYFSKRVVEEICKYHGTDSLDEIASDTHLFPTANLRTAFEGLRRRVAVLFAENGNLERANEFLTLEERDFRTSHKTNILSARIHPNFADQQTGHNLNTLINKHYFKPTAEEIAKEFELYENYSADKRAKIKRPITAVAAASI